MQDVEIDASEEDLPVEWVKKRRGNGSIYYFNVLTGAKQAKSPNDLEGTDGGAPAPTNGNVMQRIFQVSGRKEYVSSTGMAYGVHFPSQRPAPEYRP